MKDWTEIIGEQLEHIEEPLPADDWSVLQQKYASSRKRKKAAAFAWAGGITSVAAAIILVILFVNHDADVNENDLVAESLPSTEEITLADTTIFEVQTDTVSPIIPSCRTNTPGQVDILNEESDDILFAEENTDEIRVNSSPMDQLLADDFKPRRKRRTVSIGISDSFIMSISGKMASDQPYIDNIYDALLPHDSLATKSPLSSKTMEKTNVPYQETYDHDMPVSAGLSVRIALNERLSFNTGLNYTRYTSTRRRKMNSTKYHVDKQTVNYLGVPVRLDFMALNRKYFNFYIGAGMQMDKCIYAAVGDERLYEKQVLFGLNGTMGLQVNITPMIGLYLEPEMSYALNKGSIETFRSKEPFVLTMRCGFRFSL